MKLKRLIIQGFKSFKDRTTIHFDDGITGIVGPNGCGKSNIVDSLFWVMGAQSAKHLRGSNMKDLIFSGTSKYGPGGFAEASLVLENTEGKHIHIGNKVVCPNEIKITRKLYRNGETEYRLNDSPCRLKDVQEVFMDTGAGAKSYSIIAQGEINKLVQAKPVERRTMIEEVAGVTKFKIRRKESLRKMDQTQQNLDRLRDLASEIDRQLKNLQAQAEKAMKAKRLKERIEKYDLVVAAHEEFDHLRSLQENLTFLMEKRVELESNIATRDQIEIGLEEERLQRDEKQSELEELNTEFNKFSKELSAAEERLNNLCQSVSDKEHQVDTRKNEKLSIEEDIEERKIKLGEAQEKLDSIDGEENNEGSLLDLKEQLETAESTLEDNRAQQEDLEASFQELAQKKEDIDRDLYQKDSRIEYISNQIEEISGEIEAIETQYSDFHQEVSSKRATFKEATEALEDLESQVSAKKEEKAELESQFKEARHQERETSQVLTKKIAEREAHEIVISQLQGLEEGSQSLIEKFENSELSVLEQSVKCQPGKEEFIPGVNRVLETYKNVLTGNFDANEVLNFIANDINGNVDILLSNHANNIGEDTKSRVELLLGDVTYISDIIETEGHQKEAIKSLFGQFVIASNLDEFKVSSLPADLAISGIVSADGKQLARKVGGSWVFQFKNLESTGLTRLDRVNLIEALDKEISELEEQATKLAKDLQSAEEKLETSREELELLQSDYSTKKGEVTELRATTEALEKNFQIHQSKIEKLIARRKTFSEEKFSLIEEIDNLNDQKTQIDETYETSKIDLETKREEFKDLEMQVQDVRRDFMEKELQFKSHLERRETMLSQVEDLQAQLEKSSNRLLGIDEMIEGLTEDVSKLEEEIQELELSNKEKADELKEKESVISEEREILVQMLNAMADREDTAKKLTKEINNLEKSLVEKDLKVKQTVEEEAHLVKDTFEKYRIDLRAVLQPEADFNENFEQDLEDISAIFFTDEEEPKPIEKVGYEFTRRYGQDLKDCRVKLRTSKTELSKLGSINWQAVEEYERQKLRSDFLRNQEQELVNSMADLEAAIEHIDTKSRERFKLAFEEVNMRFEKVFPIIFGGGSAKLKVTGNLDDPECGVEIIAQPPGKKMQNMNLMSGGEKALTAVSLIFSIFLVKPSPFCLLDEVDAPLDDANVGRFNELLREMSSESQFILITHNKKTMELNDTLYGVTMQEPGVSKAVSVQLQ